MKGILPATGLFVGIILFFLFVQGTRGFSCGDGVCEAIESNYNCPADCQSGVRDNYCDKAAEGACDPDCYLNNDPDCPGYKKNELDDQFTKKKSERSPVLTVVGFVFLGLVIVFIAIVIYNVIRKEGKNYIEAAQERNAQIKNRLYDAHEDVVRPERKDVFEKYKDVFQK